MLYAGIEALFGRNRDHHRKRTLFSLRRRHNNHKEEVDELANLFLEKPNADKEIIHGSNFVFAAMQGWRSTMEDKHKHLTSFDNRSWKLWAYYSIFDGHNGRKKKKKTASNYFRLIYFDYLRYRYSEKCC
jgi:hypothetical protein